MTYSGTWADYGLGYQPVQYRKVGDVVQIRGSLKSGTSGTTAFTLPAGYRPPATLNLPGEASGLHAAMNITSAGAVAPICSSTAYIDITCQFSVAT